MGHSMFWLDLNWPWLVFLLAVVASIAVMRVRKWTGLLVFAVVMYLGVDWKDTWSWTPDWVSSLFWLTVIVGVIGLLVLLWFARAALLAMIPVGLAVAVVLTLLLGSGINAFMNWVDDEDVSRQARQSVSDAVDKTKNEKDRKTDPSACSMTWKMKSSTPKNGDWVESVPSIREAKTKADARAAAKDWADMVKEHPGTLAGAAAYILNKDVQAKVLVNDEGCATPRAGALVQEIAIALATADISADKAPVYGVNSGTRSGEVYAYNQRGVTGDRRAVKIVTRDGRVIWVMARCGNPVVMGNPPVPPGNPPPSFNPPPPPPEGGCEGDCNPPPKCPPGTVPYQGRCVKAPSDDGVGGNDSPASQPVAENPQGPTPGAGEEPPPPKPGPKPTPGNPAPDPTPGGHDSGSGTGSGTPGGSTTDGGGTEGGGPTGPSQPPVEGDDGTHGGDPGGF